MKKILSIALLCSALVSNIEATWSDWMLPAMMPVMCKAAASMWKSDKRDGQGNEMWNLCEKASEGSTCALAQRCMLAGVNSGLCLDKKVDLSMSSMMTDSAINTGILMCEDQVSWPKSMKSMMENPMWRTMVVCACNQVVRSVWSGISESITEVPATPARR